MGVYTNYLVNEYNNELIHDYVFINLRDSNYRKPLKYHSASDLVKRLSKTTGIRFALHILRHSHATEMINSGWDASYVQKRSGHAHVQATLQTYVHPSDKMMKKEYAKYLALKERKNGTKKKLPDTK